MTAGEGDAVVLGAANFARYSPWIELVDSLDADATAALYRRLYPQFQAAYENLGNPDSYFNDRVIEVIDHLLSAPAAPATIALVRPNVYYEFADPALEAQSAGRKLLLRMGPGNAARVKAKLTEIRDRIAAPGQSGARLAGSPRSRISGSIASRSVGFAPRPCAGGRAASTPRPCPDPSRPARPSTSVAATSPSVGW